MTSVSLLLHASYMSDNTWEHITLFTALSGMYNGCYSLYQANCWELSSVVVDRRQCPTSGVWQASDVILIHCFQLQIHHYLFRIPGCCLAISWPIYKLNISGMTIVPSMSQVPHFYLHGIFLWEGKTFLRSEMNVKIINFVASNYTTDKYCLEVLILNMVYSVRPLREEERLYTPTSYLSDVWT